MVFNGAGASAISCAEHYVRLGVRPENILMCDTKGVIYKGRTEGMNPYKERFAAETERAHAGRSAGRRRRLFRALQRQLRHPGDAAGHGAEPDRVRDGQPRPGNSLRCRGGRAPRRHHGHRPLAISRTRSTTSSGFPFIFRGALDVRATTINDEMKLAATRALAALAKEDVPDSRAARLRRSRSWNSAANTSSPSRSIRAC